MTREKVELPSNSSMPWLVFDHKVAGKRTFVTSFLDNSSYVHNKLSYLQNKVVYASQFGWEILFNSNANPKDGYYLITLWNPVTSMIIRMPPLKYNHPSRMLPKLTLTAPPINENRTACFVVVSFVGAVFACRCPSQDEDDWVAHRISMQSDRIGLESSVALDGVVYIWGFDDHPSSLPKICLVSVKVNSSLRSYSLDVNYLSISLPEELVSGLLDLDTYFDYMVESLGVVYYVVVGQKDGYPYAHVVKLWKLDLDRRVLVPVNNLGDRAIYLSTNSTTWGFANSGVKRNCLYIYQTYPVREAVVEYDLNDCSSTFLPCPTKVFHYKLQNVIWVMPQLPRSVEVKKCIDENDDENYEDVVMQLSKTTDEFDLDYMSQLPTELIVLFAKYLHLIDYWNFRCTSKMIHSVIAPQSVWGTNKNNSYPLFLVFENDMGSCRLIDPCRRDTSRRALQLDQEYFTVIGSKDCWLLVLHDYQPRFVSPFTNEAINLPPWSKFFNAIGFSTRPNCPNCLTIAIFRNYRNGTLEFKFHQFGDTKWKTHTFIDIDFNPSLSSPVYQSGAFYFLDKVGYLGVLEWVDGEINWRICNQNRPLPRRTHKCHSRYLVKHSENELLAVVIAKLGKYIKVYKFNNCEEKWVRVPSIGNHVLFIGPYSSSSVATTDIRMNDRIYLPWLKEQRSVYYSMKTLKYHVDDDRHFSCEDFFYLKNPSRCCWI